MVVMIALLAGAALLAGILGWLLLNKRGRTADYVGVSFVLVWLAGSALKVYWDGRAPADDVGKMLESIQTASWSETPSSSSVAATGVNGVGPVGSMIGGLEARLAEQPNDAKGWALLAQSYSFIGNADLAEQAVQRAVALGFAESDLRGRVELARRESGSSVEAAAGG